VKDSKTPIDRAVSHTHTNERRTREWGRERWRWRAREAARSEHSALGVQQKCPRCPASALTGCWL